MTDQQQEQPKLQTTQIKRCTCKHEFQDNHYGTGMRLHNLTDQNKAPATRKWRCTVCSTERD